MQVILGLQSNALKFTQKGKIEIVVSIKIIEKEKYLQIEVKDTGIGIDDKDKSKLFKLFGFLEDKQLVNTNGVGLGLVIA